MTELVIVAALVALLAGLAQSVSGFGFALVSVPLLALATDTRTAVVGVTMLSLVLASGATVRERAHVQWPTMRSVTITGVVGMPFGLLLLHLASERLLKILIGVLVLLAVVVLARGLRLEPCRSVTAVAGALSGALLTSTGMNGPPLVAVFHAMRLSPRTFRATMQATFAVQDLFAVLGFVVIGAVRARTLLVAVVGVPGMALGWYLGDHIFRRVPPHLFRVIVLSLMTATGCVAITQAFLA